MRSRPRNSTRAPTITSCRNRLVRAHDRSHLKELQQHGATYAVPELEVSGKRMMAQLLGALGHPEDEIRRVMSTLQI